MEKFLNICRRVLFIPVWLAVLLTAAATAGLIWVFVQGLSEHPVAYAIYVMSFYALCVVCVRLPAVIKGAKQLIHSNTHARRYLTEEDLRRRISLYTSIGLNVAYAVFKLVAGILYHSIWFGTVAIYNMVLFTIRYFVIREHKESRKWQEDRICAILLLILDVAVSGMATLMVLQNQGYSYPGYVIYVVAAYTFYRLTMTYIRVVKGRKKRHALSAVNGLDLSVSMLSLFTLQTAMFASFGGDTSEQTRRLMNAITGGFVTFSVLCIALLMLVRANKEIKKENADLGK